MLDTLLSLIFVVVTATFACWLLTEGVDRIWYFMCDNLFVKKKGEVTKEEEKDKTNDKKNS